MPKLPRSAFHRTAVDPLSGQCLAHCCGAGSARSIVLIAPATSGLNFNHPEAANQFAPFAESGREVASSTAAELARREGGVFRRLMSMGRGLP